MKIEVKDYTYEEMPDYNEYVEGAKEIVMTGHEIGVQYFPDVVYDTKEGIALHLQILVPSIFLEPDRKFPLIVFIQGSAWRKQNVYWDLYQRGRLAQRGYVVAVVEYRHSGIAHFPAQIIDGKNAIRYMKAHADEYHVDADNTFIMGDSSGGHTATLIGMTSNTSLFDEPINDIALNLRGIIDLYGAVNLTMPYGYPTALDHQLLSSNEGAFLGYNIRENEEEASKANAKTYVNLDYPPVLIVHGSKDRLVFMGQSVELYEEMKKAGKDVEFYILRNSDHAGCAFWKDELLDVYDEFIKECLVD